MKYPSIFSTVLIGLFISLIAGCTPKEEPVDPQEPTEPERPVVPESFPRKHVIEEFTGQDCGYCPYGMDCVHDFIRNDTNWIVVLHHYGYQKDNFSVSGSRTITSKLGVNGAPTITVDRAKTRSEAGNVVCFHPGYLPSVSTSQFATTTNASIVLQPQYDAATRELKVQVNGQVAGEDQPTLLLTLMVKESGMIDYQQDFYGSYEGWKEFRHTNAVRAFLTKAAGDTVTIAADRSYTAEYTLTLKEAWVPENCAVVAMLANGFSPVIQAEQRPVVSGTSGGADIMHGGVTPVPVPDYYPEPGADKSTQDYSRAEVDTLRTTQAFLSDEQYISGARLWDLQGYSTSTTYTIGGTKCIPFVWLQFITDKAATAIPVGEYELNTSLETGTVIAGYRDDEHMTIAGAMFYYTSKTYFSQGYLVPQAQWLIAEGKLTVSEQSWELIGKARNGTDIHLYGKSGISYPSGAPQRAKRRAEQRPGVNLAEDNANE